MMFDPTIQFPTRGEVLIAYQPSAQLDPWIQVVDDGLRPSGFAVRHAHSTREAISCIEGRPPRAIVVTSDRQAIDGLSLLRIVRSLNAQLPCWLVTENTNRRMLEIALAMQVISVLHQPVNGAELSIALKRVLLGPSFIQDKPVES